MKHGDLVCDAAKDLIHRLMRWSPSQRPTLDSLIKEEWLEVAQVSQVTQDLIDPAQSGVHEQQVGDQDNAAQLSVESLREGLPLAT